MTVVVLNKDTFVQIGLGTLKYTQVFGGPIQVADSDTPAANDWLTMREGTIMEFTAIKFARSVGPQATYIVALDK